MSVNGFYLNDLLELSNEFQFKLRKDSNKMESGYALRHSLKLIIKLEKDSIYFLIYSIGGGRAPESIYFFGLYEVSLNTEFYKKHISELI